MTTLAKKARGLVDGINNSKDALLLKELKDEISKDHALLQNIKAFKKEALQYELKKAQGQSVSFEEERRIGRLYARVIMSDIGARFLKTEAQLYALLNEISEIMDANTFIDTQKELV